MSSRSQDLRASSTSPSRDQAERGGNPMSRDDQERQNDGSPSAEQEAPGAGPEVAQDEGAPRPAPWPAPATPDELHDWLRKIAGVQVARTPLPSRSSAPFDYICHAYFEGRVPGRPEGPRAGGIGRGTVWLAPSSRRRWGLCAEIAFGGRGCWRPCCSRRQRRSEARVTPRPRSARRCSKPLPAI